MRSMSRFVFIMAVLMIALIGVTAAQDAPEEPQDLPAAPWYVVLLNHTTDHLIWVNNQGVQAVSSRVLPSDAVDGRPKDVRISPDGHYGLFLHPDAEGRQSLVFYDFQSGEIINTYKTELGEGIAFARPEHGGGFSPDAKRVVISVNVLINNRLITDWQAIEFDVTTGEALHVLAKSDHAFQYSEGERGNYPRVYFAPGDGLTYHFTMSPSRSGDQATLEAFAWEPANNTVTPLGTISSEFDVMAGTGRLLEPVYDDTLNAVVLPDTPLIFNVIGQRSAAGETPQALVTDETASFSNPHWAKSGAWIYYESKAPNSVTWTVRSLDPALISSYLTITPEFYGTSDGYVAYSAGDIYTSTMPDSSDKRMIYSPVVRNDQLSVVYITPTNRTFEAMTLAYYPGWVNPDAVPTDATCLGALVSRLAVGMTGRVLKVVPGQAGVLFIEPAGSMSYGIGYGTEFVIEEGPVCAKGALWWKTSRMWQGQAFTGWLRESEFGDYYLEPIAAGESSATAEPGGLTIGSPFNGIAESLNQLPTATATTAP